jgi:hypothetical protein
VLSLPKPRFAAQAVRAAVEQNPDFRLVKVDDRERVVLVPEALGRLQEVNPRPSQSSGDQPPRKLLANAATHADQAMMSALGPRGRCCSGARGGEEHARNHNA